jgi:hypothetical protein
LDTDYLTAAERWARWEQRGIAANARTARRFRQILVLVLAIGIALLAYNAL